MLAYFVHVQLNFIDFLVIGCDFKCILLQACDMYIPDTKLTGRRHGTHLWVLGFHKQNHKIIIYGKMHAESICYGQWWLGRKGLVCHLGLILPIE